MFSKGNWKNITQLFLNSCSVYDKGVKLLTQANLEKLQTLMLSCNKITSAGLNHLYKGNWSSLTNLNLGSSLWIKNLTEYAVIEPSSSEAIG